MGENELTTIQITDALYTISGQVKDENGNPLPDVIVSAGQEASSITDENGRYTLTLNLLTGTYRVTPYKKGYPLVTSGKP
jgi:protocatechuate 3,4-dioxygenase beta subunit